jgi:lysozyme
MKPSQILIDYIKLAEGFRAKAKLDVKGLAIGYGHHGPEVHDGLVWTAQQAEETLEQDIGKVCEEVEALVKVPLTQGQFDALVDFTYNLGSGRLQHSTLLTLLNQKAYTGAGQQLLRWDMVEGKPSDGLLARRQWDLERWKAAS